LQSNVARRIAGGGRQHIANGTAREGEEREQQSSATIVHAANLRTFYDIIGSESREKGLNDASEA